MRGIFAGLARLMSGAKRVPDPPPKIVRMHAPPPTAPAPRDEASRKLESDLHFAVFTDMQWRKATAHVQGGLACLVDGQPCRIYSFVEREYESYYVNLNIGPEKKSFVAAHHKWTNKEGKPFALDAIAQAYLQIK